MHRDTEARETEKKGGRGSEPGMATLGKCEHAELTSVRVASRESDLSVESRLHNSAGYQSAV